ncbi:Pr6Pr family membrane protein [Glycomyces terrestris]|uniref:Pr6Pr family membrane protein n=1 Tax=Glycomyces terrestris TaxID=2493553 RepID=UPI00165206E6|nr:Pr6Pr family membrane protein [Glycomyces terrestris]
MGARLRASRIWHGTLVAIVLAAMVTQVVLVVRGGTDVNAAGGEPHEHTAVRLVRLFSYFTIQSNLLVIAAAGLLALRPDRDGRAWRVLRLDALLGIVVTGIVFALVLAPLVHPVGVAWAVNAAFHYVSPVAFLLGWILFGPRGRIDAGAVAGAFAWPAAWIAYTFAHGAATGWYPYPFLDAGALGYSRALLNTAAVLATALALAALAAWADRRFAPLPARLRAAGGPGGDHDDRHEQDRADP